MAELLKKAIISKLEAAKKTDEQKREWASNLAQQMTAPND